MTAVQTHALGPVLDSILDARGCNLEQGSLLFSTDAEKVTLASLIDQVADRDARRRMVRVARRLMVLTSEQGACLQQAAATAEFICPSWSAARRELTVRSVADRLRPALAVIADPRGHDGIRFVQAVRTVDEVVAVLGHELFTNSLRSQLGPGRFDLLRKVAAREVTA